MALDVTLIRFQESELVQQREKIEECEECFNSIKKIPRNWHFSEIELSPFGQLCCVLTCL